MAANIRNIKRLKLLRRLGLAGLVVSSFGLIVVLILAFLPRDNSSFTIQIDHSNQEEQVHFTMSNVHGGGEETQSSYFKASPLGDAFTTEAKIVENYIDGLTLLEKQQDLRDEKSGRGLAMVYTVYLNNTSKTEGQSLVYSVSLDGHEPPSNAAEDPLSYLRVVARTYVVEENSEPEYVYYGKKITRNPDLTPTAITELGDDREPISSRRSTTDNENNTIYTYEHKSNGNDGYCINFEEFDTGYLVKGAEISIPSGKTLCFTFVAYFEGKDYDSEGAAPMGASFLLSLHFAIAE